MSMDRELTSAERKETKEISESKNKIKKKCDCGTEFFAKSNRQKNCEKCSREISIQRSRDFNENKKRNKKVVL